MKYFGFFRPRSFLGRLMLVIFGIVLVPTVLTCFFIANETKSALFRQYDAQIKTGLSMISALLDEIKTGLNESTNALILEREFRASLFYTSVAEDPTRLNKLIARYLKHSDRISGIDAQTKIGKLIFTTDQSVSSGIKRDKEKFNEPRFLTFNDQVYCLFTIPVLLTDFGDSASNTIMIRTWLKLDREWAKKIASKTGMDVLKVNTESQFTSYENPEYQHQHVPILNHEKQSIARITVGKDTAWMEIAVLKAVKTIIVAASLATVLILYALYKFLSRQTRTLNRLSNAALELKDKTPEFFQKIEVVESDPVEITTLSYAFNQMTDALALRIIDLNKAQNDLLDFNQRLEEKIIIATAELEKSTAALVQSDRMASLGIMASGIAHEINNPLAIIQMNTERIKELSLENSLGNRENIDKVCSRIDIAVTRISKIINSLRSVSRDGSKDSFELVSLFSIFEHVFSICAETLQSQGVDLKIEPIDKELTVKCRASEIEQVLLNLITNASDAIANVPDKWIEIKAKDLDQTVEISVTDSGKGIPDIVRKRIFQPFYTTKEVGKGTGLGLYISKGLIDSHDGKIEIDSNHHNTRFIIRLPAIPKLSQAA